MLTDPLEATKRLKQLGIPDAEILSNAIQSGISAYASCTANDPRSFPGILRWAKTTRALREGLAPHGWKRDNLYGLELVINGDGSIAIAVSMGNEATGTDVAPKTKYPKGAATHAAVAVNAQQLSLFEPVTIMPSQAKQDPKTLTYLLLMRLSPDMKTVHSELSLPLEIGTDLRVHEWKERIILNPIVVDPTIDLSNLDLGDDVDVEVTRKNE
jgi:hypothetical protein